ncbi:hypothetical protein EVAR_21408_1 [Eumeta japonica]|uniref:Uncharacterized protein n=1 Tax=Eumeta variegata TaxID=151549 RepID=A0A4C1VGV7_EUMVA|nr:hypothetical protein EVAR_21408_1 [Eumeta japonica]
MIMSSEEHDWKDLVKYVYVVIRRTFFLTRLLLRTSKFRSVPLLTNESAGRRPYCGRGGRCRGEPRPQGTSFYCGGDAAWRGVLGRRADARVSSALLTATEQAFNRFCRCPTGRRLVF